jgi:release factor glutamine methyltransferase
VTWKELLKQGETILRQSQVPDADLDAWYLLEFVSHQNRAWYFLHCDDEASAGEEEQFLSLTAKRSERIPLQHLTGVQEFMGLSFRVSPQVLIPRQDTELLVETLLPLSRGKKILDVCTGSGCIAISLEKLGEAEEVHGVDLSQQALEIAKQNARDLNAHVTLWQSDLFCEVTGHYDVIVSNPPYIPSRTVDTLMPEVQTHEPRMALDGGEDGLDFYRRIVLQAGRYLRREGILVVEIGCEQGEAVTALFEQNHFKQVTCRQDLCGNDRMVMGMADF